MKNIEFWNSIKNFDEHKNMNGEELICDKVVKNGLGQTKGGYLDKVENKDIIFEKAEPSQAYHFFSYYINDNKVDRSNNDPSYNNLHCPQLLMFIAEMAGLERNIIEDAYSFLLDFEKRESIIGTKKSAVYLSKYCYQNSPRITYLTKFKEKLYMSQIQKIIKNADDYEKIISEVKKLTK